MIEDMCKFFADIEADPLAPVKCTLREEIQLQNHALRCKKCADIVDRILAKYPNRQSDDPQIKFGVN